MSISVVVVDDHAVVRSGLKLLLDAEDDIEVVGEGGTAEQAVLRAQMHKPDVMLLDVVVPGKSGLEAVPDVLQASPASRGLVLSKRDDPRYVREAFEAGAGGRGWAGGVAGEQGARALQAGRPTVRAGGVRGGRERLCAEGGGGRRARGRGARGRERRELRPPRAGRAPGGGRGKGAAGGGRRSALGAGA